MLLEYQPAGFAGFWKLAQKVNLSSGVRLKSEEKAMYPRGVGGTWIVGGVLLLKPSGSGRRWSVMVQAPAANPEELFLFMVLRIRFR